MISGDVLKYLNGSRFIMAGGYEAALPASTGIVLTRPLNSIARARSFITCKNRKALVTDREAQQRAVVAKIAPRLGSSGECELDDALGLSELASAALRDSRAFRIVFRPLGDGAATRETATPTGEGSIGG